MAPDGFGSVLLEDERSSRSRATACRPRSTEALVRRRPVTSDACVDGHGARCSVAARGHTRSKGLRAFTSLGCAAQARPLIHLRRARARELPLQRAVQEPVIPPRALTRSSLEAGVRALARRDPDLRALFAQNGPPPMWGRRPGFETLIHIVLEQQVSIVAARSLFRRVRTHLGGMTPETVSRRGVNGLYRLGLTLQKASYCHELARARRSPAAFGCPRSPARPRRRTRPAPALRGIGPWSVTSTT